MEQEKFVLGQIFEDRYPPEAAMFCNERQSYIIKEIDAFNGHRRFQIQELPKETREEEFRKVEKRISRTLDEVARTRDYDNFVTAASYINSTNERYRKDAELLIEFRDTMWAEWYSLKNDNSLSPEEMWDLLKLETRAKKVFPKE